MAGLDGLEPRAGHRWYLATITPPMAIRRYGSHPVEPCQRQKVRTWVSEGDGRGRWRDRAACGHTGAVGPCDCARRARYGARPGEEYRDTRDAWLDSLRELIRDAQRQGVWDGAYVVIEAASSGQRGALEDSEEPCPVRCRWWEKQSLDVQRRARELEEACLAGVCEVCDGRGRIPVVHLHAHLLLLARPFWYGRGRVEDTDTPYKRGLAGFLLADDDAQEERVGFRTFAEHRGFQVFDFQAVNDAEGARAYAAKLVRDYCSKVSKGKRADSALLAAWMAGRRSSWATGALYGLAGADTGRLGWETLGLLEELPPEVEETPETPEPLELLRVRHYTGAWRAVTAGVSPLVLPDGPNSPPPPRLVRRGEVSIVGDVYPTVCVGGSPCGQIARGSRSPPPSTLLRTVHRGLSRYVRGHMTETRSFRAWWDCWLWCALDVPRAPEWWDDEDSPIEARVELLREVGTTERELWEWAGELLGQAWDDSQTWAMAAYSAPELLDAEASETSDARSIPAA